ncbi:MAG: PAS domain S-box protein [Granulosicoccaceae bacterium]|jgi:PAS domain S-box-containing protein
MRLQHKLTINMLLIGLVPTLILAASAAWLAEDFLLKHINEQLQYVTTETSRDISTLLRSYVRETRHLADNPQLVEHVRRANKHYVDNPQQAMQTAQLVDANWIAASGDVPLAKTIAGNNLSTFLQAYQQQYPDRYGEMFVTDVHGYAVAMTRTLSDYYQADEQWWYDSYNSGQVFIDDRGYDTSANAVVVGIVMPVRDGQQLIGMLKISFSLQGVIGTVAEHTPESNDRLMIVRDDGTVLYTNRGEAHHTEMNPAIYAHLNDSTIVPFNENGRDVLSSQARVEAPYPFMSRSLDAQGVNSESWQPRDWHVMLHADLETAYMPIRRFHGIAGLLVLMILGAVLVGGLRLGQVLSAPLQKLQSGIARVRHGALHHRVDTSAGGEIGALANDFNDMTAELEKTLTSRDVLKREIRLRKTVETSLRESEQRFRATFEQAAVGIAHVGLDGCWLRVNQRLCEIIGYSEEELLEKTFQDITYPDDLDADLVHVQQLLEGKAENYTLEKRYIRKQGSIVWVNLTVAMAHKPDGSPDYFISVIEDIDEKKYLQENLQSMNERLEQRVSERTAELSASKQRVEHTLQKLYQAEQQMLQAEKMAAMGTFAAGIAHELNNPLTGVLNYVQYTRDNIDDKKLRNYLDKAEHNTLRATKVIQNMLNYSRQSQAEIQDTDIATTIEQAVEIMRPELNKEHIDIKLDLQQTLPSIRANIDTLQQIFINLMANARDAMEQQADKRIAIRAGEEDGFIQVSITDNGSGIPENISNQIFDPFFTTKAPGKGTGLGLALCQRIISNLGGSISYHSEEGRGTTFDLYIPLQKMVSEEISDNATNTGY